MIKKNLQPPENKIKLKYSSLYFTICIRCGAKIFDLLFSFKNIQKLINFIFSSVLIEDRKIVLINLISRHAKFVISITYV